MGRIRTVLPEIVANAKFAALTDGAARLCYGLLSLVDDAGRCNASPQYLAGQIFFIRTRPMNVISKLIGELEAASFIARYEADGAQYLEIVGFLPPPKGKKLARSVLSQRIDRPQPSQIPAPSWADSSNGSPNDSTPYHDPDPDPRPPTAISESEEGGKKDRTAAPLAGGLTPRPGGRAEKLMQDLDARAGAGAGAERLAAANEYVVSKSIDVDNAEAFLIQWCTRALKKLEKPKPRKEPKPRGEDKPARKPQAPAGPRSMAVYYEYRPGIATAYTDQPLDEQTCMASFDVSTKERLPICYPIPHHQRALLVPTRKAYPP